MFCKNCGTKINKNEKYCYKCGNKIEKIQEKSTFEDNNIIFQLKPIFNVAYILLNNIPLLAIYILFIYTILINIENNYILKNLYPIIIILVILYFIIKLLCEKIRHDQLEYNFYNTKVEYKDAFINIEIKTLEYKYIREVSMTQNILERLFNIGTIRIYTSASTTTYDRKNSRGQNGIYIHCINNIQEQYNKIKEIIDEDTTDE